MLEAQKLQKVDEVPTATRRSLEGSQKAARKPPLATVVAWLTKWSIKCDDGLCMTSSGSYMHQSMRRSTKLKHQGGMYPRSSAVVGLDRIAYEAMWAVHLGRTYGTGQHRHKKWSVLQTVMARAGYDSTPHSQPAASGPPQQSSWSTLLSPTTRSYAEGLALGIPLP